MAAMDAPCSLFKALNLETPNARLLQRLRTYTMQTIQQPAVVTQQPAVVQIGPVLQGLEQVPNPSGQRPHSGREMVAVEEVR